MSRSNTQITDDNIRKLVNLYYKNSDLPLDLRDKSINDWDVSKVTNFFFLFGKNCRNFNEPLDKWDVSNALNMDEMFSGCTKFNQPLNDWNVSNVDSMDGMFSDCTNFNQPLNNWNVSNVDSMRDMFRDCTKFNQPLNDWNVSNVKNTLGMFSGCKTFNQPLNDWNVSNVKQMRYMFSGCTNFNQPLNDWNVSNVIDMKRMFRGCTNFNQPLNGWNINSNVEMREMFKDCHISNNYKPIHQNSINRDVPVFDVINLNHTNMGNFISENNNNVVMLQVIPNHIQTGEIPPVYAFVKEDFDHLLQDSIVYECNNATGFLGDNILIGKDRIKKQLYNFNKIIEFRGLNVYKPQFDNVYNNQSLPIMLHFIKTSATIPSIASSNVVDKGGTWVGGLHCNKAEPEEIWNVQGGKINGGKKRITKKRITKKRITKKRDNKKSKRKSRKV